MRNESATTNRNAGIDLLRGLSIVLVVIHHVALRIPLRKTTLAGILPAQLLRALNWNGHNAVIMFFVISGFLITETTIRRWGSLASVPPGAFMVRRAARIIPCLLVLIVILSFLDLLQVPDYTITRPDQSLGGAIFSALTMTLNRYEGRTSWLPGGWDILWSLSIEELFYLIFPFACLLSARFPRLLIMACTALALSMPLSLRALTNASEIWQDKAYLPGMSAIATGICAALIAGKFSRAKPGSEQSRRIRTLSGLSGTIALAACLLDYHDLYGILGDNTDLLLTVSVAALLVAFRQGWGATVVTRGTGWLRSFGRMSYEIYLSHMFIVFPAVALFHRTGGNMALGWLWFPPVLALSWCLGRAVELSLSRPADLWLLQQTRTARPAIA
ncbi:acyltransferase family protein [Acetobacter musti]|uniref:Acyltransferase family protein n=1 Tax=Acetobacter musti TaxID=864732 RepID=A0ABX0JM86_9PROT|nr:acyltransferase [Acetobacter musti]NHN83586.1 acyltransferase family protein [Acetobacter musti]